MNRRLTRQRRVSAPRGACRVDNRGRVAAGARALLAFTTGIGIFFSLGASPEDVSRSVLLNQNIKMVPEVAEARSPMAAGHASPIGTQEKTESSVGLGRDVPEAAIGLDVDWGLLVGNPGPFPRVSFARDGGRVEKRPSDGIGPLTACPARDSGLVPSHCNNIDVSRIQLDPDSEASGRTPPGGLEAVGFVCLHIPCQLSANALALTMQGQAPPPTDSSPADSVDASNPGETPGASTASSGWVEMASQPGPPPGGPQLAPVCGEYHAALPTTVLPTCLPSTTWASGTWGLAFQYGALEGGFAGNNNWHLSVNTPSGMRISTAVALQTPLQDFGALPLWGIGVRTQGGLEVIETSLGVQVVQHVDIPGGEFFAGNTPEGRVGGVQFTVGSLTGNVTALLADGQVQTVGTLSLNGGDVGLTISQDPMSLQFGISYAMPNGPTFQAFWSSMVGFQIGLMMRLDESPITASLGSASLAIDVPPAPDGSLPSARFRWSLPEAAGVLAQATPTPSSSPTLLVVRACVDAQRTGTCGQAEPLLRLRFLMDGEPMIATNVVITIAPGHHIVTVPVEAAPPHLVPLRGLTCDLTVPASSVAVCDLPFGLPGTL